MIFDTMSILAYAVGLVLIKPIKWLAKFVINGVLGGLILAAVNFVGGFAGMYVIINPLTSLISGFLGVPGVLLVIVLQYIL